MKVYLVYYGSDILLRYQLVALFSKKENAEGYVAEKSKHKTEIEHYVIYDKEVDDEVQE